METILKKKAAVFRERYHIGLNEPLQLHNLLSELGVLTVFMPLPGDFSGMALLAGDKRFMLINADHPLGKQHFTICHELYHLFVQEGFTSQHCITGRFDKRHDKQEYYADVFAANLLMPEHGLIERIPDEELKGRNKISIETILKIEQHYACSRKALLYRLFTMDLISADYQEQFKHNVIRSARQYGYTTALYSSANNGLIIGDYAAKAKKLFDAEKISEPHYLELMTDIGIELEKEGTDEWKY